MTKSRKIEFLWTQTYLLVVSKRQQRCIAQRILDIAAVCIIRYEYEVSSSTLRCLTEPTKIVSWLPGCEGCQASSKKKSPSVNEA